MVRGNGADGIPDLKGEQFVFLADQANMPYGAYYAESKSDLLVEHILKDVQFLLSDKYYANVFDAKPSGRKKPVKVIVVACNTATVYGKATIEQLLQQAGLDIKVIGVIDAGAKGALAVIEKNEDATIGVLATVGTIASRGYPDALRKFAKLHDRTGRIEVIGQGGHGLAESLDGEPGFINPSATSPTGDYNGPALANSDFPIDKALLKAYNFDTLDNNLLCDTNSEGDCAAIQLNSPVNYARYHVVSLLEQLRRKKNAPPLKAIILGCTHYPYLKSELKLILNELYNLNLNGKFVYRNLLARDVRLIDPSENVAAELTTHLKEAKLFDEQPETKFDFFISVPNLMNPNVQVADSTHFTYQYKYGRVAGAKEEYVKMVPFARNNISLDVLNRLATSVPLVYQHVSDHLSHNSLVLK